MGDRDRRRQRDGGVENSRLVHIPTLRKHALKKEKMRNASNFFEKETYALQKRFFSCKKNNLYSIVINRSHRFVIALFFSALFLVWDVNSGNLHTVRN